MRVSICLVVAGCLFLCGCGGGGSTPTAGTGSPAGPPAPPGGAPPPPPGAGSSDGDSGGGENAPAEPMPNPEGTPPGGETPPPTEAPQPSGSPDGGQPEPGERGVPGGGFGGLGFGGGGGSPEGGGSEGGLPDLSSFKMPPPQKSLRDQAIDAYRAGDEATGMQLLLTHFAIVPGAERELNQKMGWYAAMPRRVALGPRIGLAAFYDKPPRDFEGSPMPIGSTELATALSAINAAQQQGNDDRRRKKAKAGGEQAPPAGNPEDFTPGTPKGDLFFHTGELGTKFLEALQLRIDSGEYGQMYKDITEAVARPALPDDPNNPGGDPNNPDGGEGGRGGIGGALPAVPGGIPDGGVEGAAAAASAAQPLGLAVVWLGKVTSKEEAARLAEQAQVDFLATYEIVVRVPKGTTTDFVNNSTLLRITSVKKGDLVFAGKALNNLTVGNLQNDEKVKEDPAEKEIERAIEALDKVCKAAPLPALTAEQVKGRIASLIAEKPANPLPVVVEARLYVAKGLLSEVEMQAAAVSLLGEAEYARLVTKSAGSGMGQMLGSALSLPGMMNMVRGANAAAGVAGAASRAGGAGGGPAPPAGEGQPKRGGLRGLLPF